MGYSISTLLYSNTYQDHPNLLPLEKFFNSLKLSASDVGRLYSVFLTIGKTFTPTILIDEFRLFFKVDQSNFIDRLIYPFDIDRNGLINFKTFVIVLWNYCTLGQSEFASFAFDLYDTETRQELSLARISMMVQDLYGQNFVQNPNAVRILNSLQEIRPKKKECIDVQIFKDFCRSHGSLLAPAFTMQRTMRQRVLGLNFWDVMSKRRLKLLGDKNISKIDLLKLQKEATVIFANKSISFADGGTFSLRQCQARQLSL
eukprot:gene4646-9218_t